MQQEMPLNLYKISVTVVGAIFFAVCLISLPVAALSWGFLGLLVFSVLVAPRISLAIPRSNLAVTFSDALIFLAFLIYGPESAVVLAAVEKIAHCYYNKWKGNIKFGKYMIWANASAEAISTSFCLPDLVCRIDCHRH
jgi:hypothetical protein